MKKQILICIAIQLINTVCFAQIKFKIIPIPDDDPTPIYYPWLGTDSKILTSMGMVYTKPIDFKEIRKIECFDKTPQLSLLFGCQCNQIHATDGQVIAFMPIFRPFTQKDSMDIKSVFPGAFVDVINKQHISMIKAVLGEYYGKEVAENWTDSVSYYPEKIAKERFQADTVIRYSIVLKPEDYYKKKYKYMDALFLTKKGSGYVSFYCFYTDKAKANLDFYWRKIEGVLRYKE